MRDTQINVVTAGHRDSPALLLLHGFMGSHRDWTEAAETLCEDYYCIMPDLPGHGSTRWDFGDYGSGVTVRLLDSMLDAYEVERASVIGYSMGARIALLLAHEKPGRVERLVLESGSPGLLQEHEREQRVIDDTLRAARLRSEGIESFVRDWYEMPLFESLHGRPDLLRELRRRRLENDPEGLARSLEGIGTGVFPPLYAMLAVYEMPVLLICGLLDGKYFEINDFMATRMPNARLKVVRDAGHNVHLEEPEAWLDAVTTFLAGEPDRKT